MNKFVYLFELDSVRKTDEEIREGQRALFEEIAINGNIVVMTYNQVVDSRGFFSLLRDQVYKENLLKLFERGAIKISQYGDIRTVAQYLLNSIEDNKKFIYSSLPVKFSQKRLLALMRRCLTYSDLSEMEYYLHHENVEEKFNELFIEVENGNEIESKLSLQEKKTVIRNLKALLETVLKLSMLSDIYIWPKNTEEYSKLKLSDIIKDVCEIKNNENVLFENAKVIIQTLKTFEKRNNDRSVYLRELKDAYKRNGNKESYQYAEAIINLCYNYVCESSVCNISKHYNVSEFENNLPEKSTFVADFFSRLEKYWGKGINVDKKFLVEEDNKFDVFNCSDCINDAKMAVRLTDYRDYNSIFERKPAVQRYEYELEKQRKRYKSSIRKNVYKKFIFAVLCIGIACGFEFFFNYVETIIDQQFKIGAVIETFLMLGITEFVTTKLSERFSDIMPLSDAIKSIMVLFKDMKQIILKKSSTYFNYQKEYLDEEEKYSQGRYINLVCSNSLKKYIKEFGEQKIQHQINLNERKEIEEIVKLEELYNYHFGIVYESKFNRMIVDPIKLESEKVIPYERISPTEGNGAVILPKYKDKFLLLRQFRHAIQKEQYAFPRGFSDKDCTPLKNMERELNEELNVKTIKSVVKLGEIAPDSGLTGSIVHIWKVDVADYEYKGIHEGIKEIVELTEKELVEWICEGKIDDGFTLGAYLLYQHQNRFKRDEENESIFQIKRQYDNIILTPIINVKD